MKLLVDIGNTKTKLCFYTVESVNHIFEASQPEDLGSIDFINEVTNCLLSASGDETKWVSWLKYHSIKYKIFDTSLKIPIRLNYKTPVSLGKDRVAAVCGAQAIYPDKNVLVIDAGTAITYDILSSKGNHLGGNISPGIEMRYKALNTFTKRLPLINFKENINGIGNSTEEAMHKGVQYGIVSEVIAYISEWRNKLEQLEVVVTGGDARFFEKSLKSNIFVEPNLVVFGLKSILKLNE